MWAAKWKKTMIFSIRFLKIRTLYCPKGATTTTSTSGCRRTPCITPPWTSIWRWTISEPRASQRFLQLLKTLFRISSGEIGYNFHFSAESGHFASIIYGINAIVFILCYLISTLHVVFGGGIDRITLKMNVCNIHSPAQKNG